MNVKVPIDLVAISDLCRRWRVTELSLFDALEAQVAVSNQSIAQAEAHFRAARAAIGVTCARRLLPEGDHGRLSDPLARRGGARRDGQRLDRQLRHRHRLLRHAGGRDDDVSYEVDLWGLVRRMVEANVATAEASA
jgi:outer membrane protein TolC